MKLYRILIIGIFLLSMAGCQNTDEVQESNEVESLSKGLLMNQDMISRAGITFGKIEKRILSMDVNARGQLEVLPENKALVSVMLGGVIKSINIRRGQTVSRGMLLATYSHPDFIAIQQKYLKSKNDLALIEKNYYRQKELEEQNINSKKTVQQVEAEYQNALVAFNGASAEMELLGIDVEKLEKGQIFHEIRISSPIDGVINDIFITMGKYVDMASPLFEIINTKDLYLTLKVFEKDIHKIKEGQRVTFTTSRSASNVFEAKVKSIGSVVETDMRIIEVNASITNKIPDVIPGMFVSSTIHTSEDFLESLPESALVFESNEKVYGFYTLDDPLGNEIIFQKFFVKTGFTEDGYIEVEPLSEVPQQAKIVMDGVYYIKSEMMKNLEE